MATVCQTHARLEFPMQQGNYFGHISSECNMGYKKGRHIAL